MTTRNTGGATGTKLQLRLKRVGPRSRWCSSACPKFRISEHGVGSITPDTDYALDLGEMD